MHSPQNKSMRLLPQPSFHDYVRVFALIDAPTFGGTELVRFHFQGAAFKKMEISSVLDEALSQSTRWWSIELWNILELLLHKKNELIAEFQPSGA